MALPQHGHSSIVSLCRILWLCLLEMLIDIELHDGTGKVLGQAVVDFVGDQLPFMVAGFQQVPRVRCSCCSAFSARLRSVMSLITTAIRKGFPLSSRMRNVLCSVRMGSPAAWQNRQFNVPESSLFPRKAGSISPFRCATYSLG